MNHIIDELPEPQRIALAYATAPMWGGWVCLFGMDFRLGRIVAGTNETMLGQMRLAWWRDQLSLSAEQRPSGDAVLTAIGAHWQGHETALISLINGWEALLTSEQIDDASLHTFAKGRAAAFTELATMAGALESIENVEMAATRWALVDFAFNSSTDALSDLSLNLAGEIPQRNISLSRDMRPLTILDGLARRAINQGRKSLLGDRFSPIFALRLGLFGR